MLYVDESEWPRLYADLEGLGQRLGLDVFDSSLSLNHVKTFGVGICSPNGLFLDADGRIWLEGPFVGDYRGVRINLYAYRDDFDWRTVADALVEVVQQNWAEVAEVDWRTPTTE